MSVVLTFLSQQETREEVRQGRRVEAVEEETAGLEVAQTCRPLCR